MALISDSRIDEAKNEIQKIQSEYSSSPVISLLNAEICYKTKDYNNAVSLTKSLIQTLSNDSENLYTANYILGKSLSAQNQSDKAIEAYEAARQQKETALILRTIGSEQLKKAEQSGYSQDYKNAYNTFKLLDEKYCALTDDIINLAQSAMLAGDNSQYDFCKNKLLDETAKNEDCRVYIMLCMMSDLRQSDRGLFKKDARAVQLAVTAGKKLYFLRESCKNEGTVQKVLRTGVGVMNSTTILGIAMISAGIILFAVSQLLLRRWIKKYNEEWMEGADTK